MAWYGIPKAADGAGFGGLVVCYGNFHSKDSSRDEGAFMIVSTGVDLIEVARIQQALEDPRTGRRFRERVYTAGEIAYCESKHRGKYESYAGRFAAKEAVMKALGRGWGSKVAWAEIEVARARSGKPGIVLHDKTAQFAEQLGIHDWVLSITHTKEHGLAYVIAQQQARS